MIQIDPIPLQAGVEPSQPSVPDTAAACPLRAIILLIGTASASELVQAVARSSVNLPVDSASTVRDLWRSRIEQSRLWAGPDRPEVRLVGTRVAAGLLGRVSADPILRCEQEPVELRGTGGVLRDVTLGYPDDAFVLVAAAGQIVMEPLDRIIQQLCQAASDAALLVHEDGSPCSLMLLRCGCLRCIPEVGFVDLKEQALPRIAAAHSVSAVRSRTVVAASIRTHEQYIRALRLFHARQSDPPAAGPASPAGRAGESAFAEDWKPSFGIVEPGAVVDPAARVHDSVVLAGAHVGRGAVLVRSIICPGAVVGRGEMIVDRLATRRSAAPATAAKRGTP